MRHPMIARAFSIGLVTGALTAGSDSGLAQTAGPLGTRTVKAYWQENGAFFALIPTTPFDNTTGSWNLVGSQTVTIDE